MRRILFSILFLLASSVFALEQLKPLPADQAFQFSTQVQQNQLIVQWQIAPNYFIYRDKVKFKLEEKSQVKIGEVILPVGLPHKDEIRGAYQIYTGLLSIPVPLIAPAQGSLALEVNYQGCSLQGFCYPPVKKHLQIDVKQQELTSEIMTAAPSSQVSQLSGQSYTNQLLGTSNRFLLILGFFGFGLLLAFTPCVLPMVPILSSIIVGHHKKTDKSKALPLSIMYVLGMAITYAIAGMIIAMIGSGFQAALQKTWVTVLVSVLFVVLAFWLLDFYHMRLPAHWQRRITNWSQKQKGGSYFSVFLMGVFSTLIVSPCVSAPLVGVLAYIAQTGNVIFGGFALLALGLGMGSPLLLLGMSAGKILPKAGAWMNTVQQSIAILMLGMAIWMLSRVIPGVLSLFLWGLLLCFAAFLLGLFAKAVSDWGKLRRAMGLIAFIYGIILMTGAVMGNNDPLNPWENWKMASTNSSSTLAFFVIKDMKELNQQLAQAAQDKKIVMLDFYADWCTACVVMDKHVFNNTKVSQMLNQVVLLRADVTANNDFDKKLLKRYQLVAPPVMLFFAKNGKELPRQRIIGEVSAKQFIAHFENEVINASR